MLIQLPTLVGIVQGVPEIQGKLLIEPPQAFDFAGELLNPFGPGRG